MSEREQILGIAEVEERIIDEQDSRGYKMAIDVPYKFWKILFIREANK